MARLALMYGQHWSALQCATRPLTVARCRLHTGLQDSTSTDAVTLISFSKTMREWASWSCHMQLDLILIRTAAIGFLGAPTFFVLLLIRHTLSREC